MTGKLTRKLSMALIIAVLVTALSMTLCLENTYAASGAGYATGKVSKGITLRQKASTKSKKVAVLKKNTVLTIKKEVFTSRKSSAKKYRWYKVTTANGKSGYIRSDYVKSIKYKSASGKTTAKVTYRKGAGAAMKYKGKITKGKSVNVVLKASATGSGKTWYKIRKGLKYYYVTADKISFATTGTSAKNYNVASTTDKIKNVKTETSEVTIDGIDFVLQEIRYPDVVYEGSAFGLTGLVIASEPMTKMTVGVKNSGGAWVLSASMTLNGTTGNIYDLDKYVSFGKLTQGTYKYTVEVTVNGKTLTPISRQFTVKKPVQAQKITSKAFELAWPAGTAKSKYQYPSGKPTTAYKNALNAVYPGRKWGAAPQVGASCDVFVGTVLRSCGYVPDMPRGLSEQIPYLAKSPKFRDIGYNGNRNMLQSGDIILYNHYSGTHICIYVVKNGKAYIAEANYQSTYGRLEESASGMDYRLRTSGKKYIKVYRAVE